MLKTIDVNPAKAREHVMLKRLLTQAKVFYSDAKNREAYDAWLKVREQKLT